MEWEDREKSGPDWRKERPDQDGLYEYRGSLYEINSESSIDCSSSCRVNVRTGDGLRMSIYGEDGREYDVARTGDGMWRGPIGPVHIPVEDARRTHEQGAQER